LTKNKLDILGPLYHSYRLFGVENEQIEGIYAPNQASKEPIILAYIMLAIAKCRTLVNDSVSFADLFCADGYFAMAARKLGATEVLGIDDNREGHSVNLDKIAALLGLDRVEFRQMDVNEIDHLNPVDIVANIGGLYHIDNPIKILEKSYDLARKYLIIQTVVSIATNDDEYYESPAPGWHWGNRFSRASFEKLISSKGWSVLDKHFNELEGNDRLEDRGSIYFLIEKN